MMTRLLLLFALLQGFAFSAFAAVDLNTASQEELATVNGIGPVKAQAIIDYRKGGPFKSVDDLNNVKGFGRKTVEKVRGELTVSEPRPGKARHEKKGSNSQDAARTAR